MAEKTENKAKTPTSKINIPTVKDLFGAGAQFGHEAKRWNPKMEQYIYAVKKDIHIIDITKTKEQLEKAAEFLQKVAAEGEIILVGTKKQASQIIKDNAINAGTHFIDQRWAGGLLTNFKKVKESFRKLRNLETAFEKGVEDRTKYEISLMKKEWQKLNRLYSGVKTLSSKPKAIVVIDTRFEKGAVREARKMHIPIVGIVDTNSDPSIIDYPIPANDDAISSIKLIVNTLTEAIKAGNKGGGVHHLLKDYAKVEVEIKKSADVSEEKEEQDIKITSGGDKTRRVIKKTSSSKSKTGSGKASQTKGILEKVQEAKKKNK